MRKLRLLSRRRRGSLASPAGERDGVQGIWRRRARRRTGEIAVQEGFARREHIGWALERQRALRERGHAHDRTRLGVILVEMGLLSREQLKTTLRIAVREHACRGGGGAPFAP